MLIGALANAACPPFAGFFSKDAIIEAVQLAHGARARTFAYLCVLACVFVTALYTFRLVFFAFHGEERFRQPRRTGTTTTGTTSTGTPRTSRTSRPGW